MFFIKVLMAVQIKSGSFNRLSGKLHKRMADTVHPKVPRTVNKKYDCLNWLSGKLHSHISL